MLQNPQHDAWGGSLYVPFAREELIERIYSTIKSVQFTRQIAQNVPNVPGNLQEGVLPLMQRLAFLEVYQGAIFLKMAI